MRRVFLNDKGFSLAEIMIVVAIIGILATIAVPNMTLMTERARQSEAKAELQAIYASEKSFYSEFSYYTYCLNQCGYQPSNQRRFYLTGFWNGRVCGQGKGCTYDSVPTACSFSVIPWNGSGRNDATYFMNQWANPSLSGSAIEGNYDVAADGTFNAVAFGSVSGRAPIFDVWTMNDGKNLVNIQVGL